MRIIFDFESQMQALFDNPCEHLWKSNQKNIVILLIFLLKSTPCWLTSAKFHHWGHTTTSVQVHLTISRKHWIATQLKNAKNFIELYFKTKSHRERQEFKQQMIQMEAKVQSLCRYLNAKAISNLRIIVFPSTLPRSTVLDF